MTQLNFLISFSMIAAFSLSAPARASIMLTHATIDETGASNIIMPTAADASENSAPNIYFSNISSRMVFVGSGLRYVADGSSCSPLINPHCHNAADTLTLSMVGDFPTPINGTMYLVYCGGAAPVVGNPVSSCSILNQQSYADSRAIPPLSVSWSAACAAMSAIGGNLSVNCTNQTYENSDAFFYLVDDRHGSGLISKEILPLHFWFVNSIPATSVNNFLGLFNFSVEAQKGAAQITNIVSDSTFPTNEGVGIQFVRFYYVGNPDGGVSYQPAAFNEIGFLNTPAEAASYLETSVDNAGAVKTNLIPLPLHQRYYFRAALVDRAGNVGYLTEDTDGPSHSTIPR